MSMRERALGSFFSGTFLMPRTIIRNIIQKIKMMMRAPINLKRFSQVTSPWTKSNIQGFYHDMSLFWDDDGRVYTVCGNTEIHLIELKSDLSGPKEGGINKIIIQSDREKCALGYEGSHLYKINGRYYNFMIYIPKGRMRTEVCYMADSLEGPWTYRKNYIKAWVFCFRNYACFWTPVFYSQRSVRIIFIFL